MHIDRIYYFDYTKEVGFYDSIRNFRSVKMTYVGLALSTPQVKVNASPTEHKIDERTSSKIREFVVSRLDGLREISNALAENSPKCFVVCFSDDTKRYYEYNEDFHKVFQVAKQIKSEEKREAPIGSFNVYGKDVMKVTDSTPPTTSYFNRTPSSLTNTSHYTPSTKQKTSSLLLKTLLILVVVGILMLFLTNYVNTHEKVDSNQGLSVVDEPLSGSILSGKEAHNESAITVNASYYDSCVVKLKDFYDAEIISFYVREGETVTVGVPNGNYYVYFAYGDTWYGKEHLFGANTIYKMDDKIRHFSNTNGEYTLYSVTDGNLVLSSIDADEF